MLADGATRCGYFLQFFGLLFERSYLEDKYDNLRVVPPDSAFVSGLYQKLLESHASEPQICTSLFSSEDDVSRSFGQCAIYLVSPGTL